MNIRFVGTCRILMTNWIGRRSIIERWHIRFPRLRYYEDTAFLNKYKMACRFVNVIPDRLYIYKLRENSLTEQLYDYDGNDYRLSYQNIANFITIHPEFEKWRDFMLSEWCGGG